MSDMGIYTDGHGTTVPSGSVTIPTPPIQTMTPIVATPASGYTFWYWGFEQGLAYFADMYNPNTSVRSVFPPPADDILVRAHFKPVYETLTIDTDGNGSTIPNVQQQVQASVPINITAIPGQRYYFKNWDVINGSAIFSNSAAATTLVTITADATIIAKFDTKLITVGNIPDDTPGIGIELRDDGKIYCYVIDARDTGDSDQLDYNATVSANNSTIAVFNTTNINFYDGGYHNILFEWSIANNESRYGILHVDNNYYTPESSTATKIGKQTPCSFNFDSSSGTFVALGASLYGEGSSALSAYNSNNKTFTGQYHKFIVWDTVLSNQAYLYRPGEFDPFVKQIINQAEIDPLLDSNLQSWKYNVVTYHKFDSLDVSVSAPTFSVTGFVPADGTSGVALTTALSWICTDPLGLAITYDVFFGVQVSGITAITQVATAITASTVTVSGLAILTNYNWFVVANNTYFSTTSVTNVFTTVPYKVDESGTGKTLSCISTMFYDDNYNFESLSISGFSFIQPATLTSYQYDFTVTGDLDYYLFSDGKVSASGSPTKFVWNISSSTANIVSFTEDSFLSATSLNTSFTGV